MWISFLGIAVLLGLGWLSGSEALVATDDEVVAVNANVHPRGDVVLLERLFKSPLSLFHAGFHEVLMLPTGAHRTSNGTGGPRSRSSGR